MINDDQVETDEISLNSYEIVCFVCFRSFKFVFIIHIPIKHIDTLDRSFELIRKQPVEKCWPTTFPNQRPLD